MRFERFPALFVLLSFAATCAYPQASPTPPPSTSTTTVTPRINPKADKSRLRDLKGAVKDESDNPVEGAIVKLKNGHTGKVVEFITKRDGAYLFYDLNMDTDYDLTVVHEGFEDGKKTLSKYDSRKPATLNLQLEHKKPA
jgi:hypothetical protein